MQGELEKSIRDAEKGAFPLGPLISFKKASLIRRKTEPQGDVSDIEAPNYTKQKSEFQTYEGQDNMNQEYDPFKDRSPCLENSSFKQKDPYLQN